MAAITGTVIVHEPLFAGIEPCIKVTVEPPVGALTVPLQLVLALPAITIPVGNVSVNGAIRLAVALSGLLRVMVRVDIPPALMVAGLKALPRVGLITTGALTVKVAMAGLALLPLPVCKAPAANELMKFPPLAAVTVTVTVQKLLAGIEPPVKMTFEPPVVAVTAPPQVVLGLPATSTPLGNVSVNGAVKLASVASGLLKVRVRVDVPPALIVAGLKALPRAGVTTKGELTVKVEIAEEALLPFPVFNTPAASKLM